MRSFILLLCLIPTIICAQNFSLEDQLKQAIKGKKAEIGHCRYYRWKRYGNCQQ